MKFKTDPLGVKIIHWEYNDLSGSITKIDFDRKMTAVNKPDTKDKCGLQFRYIVKFHKEIGLRLNCIAEEVFINDGIVDFTFEELKELMQYSFDRFNVIFEEKIKSEGHSGASIQYTIKDIEVHRELKYLQTL